jgi:hypothetical protein
MCFVMQHSQLLIACMYDPFDSQQWHYVRVIDGALVPLSAILKRFCIVMLNVKIAAGLAPLTMCVT